nr:MAG TPA: hypothetical protein [Caudoviricetes sp.]
MKQTLFFYISGEYKSLFLFLKRETVFFSV